MYRRDKTYSINLISFKIPFSNPKTNIAEKYSY